MPHVVLVGDSILDNAAYTQGGPDVVSQVRGLLPPGWEATLLAVDGATTDRCCGPARPAPGAGDTPRAQRRWQRRPDAPRDSGDSGILNDESRRSIGGHCVRFRETLPMAIAACLDTALPLAVCTIYNGCFDDRSFQRLASTTLTVFNDAIIRVAIEHSLPVIDLRSVCVTREDYANPIEPSSVGGEKIARVIVGLVCGARTTAPATRIVVAVSPGGATTGTRSPRPARVAR